MNECSGIFGKIFGHKFTSFALRKVHKQPSYINVEGQESVLKYIDSLSEICEVRCKRCGKRNSETN